MAGWSKLSSANVMKVKCKGVFSRAERQSIVGCIIRNNKGSWVRGAAGIMGFWVPVVAELWVIYYGLKMAWERGVTKSVFVESYCEEAVNEVNNPDLEFWLADLVGMIINLRNEAWDFCAIVYVSEDVNEASITLTNGYLRASGGLVELDDAPAFMEGIIAA